MSKNFELLQRAQKEQEKRGPSGDAGGNGAHPRMDLSAMAGEETVKMVQRVFLMPGPGAPRAVVFSGVEHGDGCSWICSSAATALVGQAPGSVCVVDANLRRPSLHRYFGMENRVGLCEAVVQPGPIRNFAQQVAGSGELWLLPCGSATSDPHAVLHSEGFRARVTELRAEFDNVLFDAPPVNLYADAIALGQLTDGIIMVLQSNTTRREAARRAKESFEAANVRLLGAVLNKRTFPVPQAFYGKL